MRRFSPQKNSSYSSNYRLRPRNSPQDLKLKKNPTQKSHSKNSFSSNLISINQDSIIKIQKCEINNSGNIKILFPGSIIREKSENIIKFNSISPKPYLKLPSLCIFNKKNQINQQESIILSLRRKKSEDSSEDKINMCTIGTSTNEETDTTQVYDRISLNSKSNFKKKTLLRCKDLTNILDTRQYSITPDFHCFNENLYKKRIRLIKDLRKNNFPI